MSRAFFRAMFGSGAPVLAEPETVAYLTFAGIPDDATVFYAATAQEITGAQIWTAVNNYVLALKAADIAGANWTNAGTATCIVVRDNLFIGGTALRHSYNLADPTKNLTFFGSWVHDALGIRGNGANTYANDGIRNTDLASLVALYHGFTVLDGGSGAGGGMWLGGARIPGVQEFSHLRINTNLYGCPNTIIASIGIYSGSLAVNHSGDFAQQRNSGGGGNNTTQYINGVPALSGFFGNVPQALNMDIYVGGLNQNGTLVNPFLGDIRHAFIANGLTLAQHNAWFAARNALQTALNRVP